MFYTVIWYVGCYEQIRVYETAEAAATFIADTGMDPDEFETFESETDPLLD